MDGANGTALEWALALLRAPAERYRLRQRPLPPGVDALLAIAANVAPDALDSEGARLRESDETLREAARFYAREVLFHAEADAYRTLGVAPEATTEQIKAHHRLLQTWLHPDREQSGDDSVFAARINTAWNQLRSPDRRTAYDAERASMRLATDVEPEVAGMATPPVSLWHPPAPAAPALGRRRHRLLVFGLLGACLLLGGLVLRESGRPPEPWARNDASSLATEHPPAVLLEVAPAPDRDSQSPGAGTAKAAPPDLPEPAIAFSEQTPDVRLMAASVDGEQVIREPTARLVVSTEAPRTQSPAFVESARSAEAGQHRVRSRTERSAAAPVPTESAAPVARSPAPNDPGSAPATRETPTERVAATAGTPVAAPEAASASSRDSLIGRLRQAFGQHRETRAAQDLGVEGDVAFDRIQQARQVGQLLLRYLAANNRTPPPIWDSAATLDRADGLRRTLHTSGSPRLGAAQWRIGNTTAALASDYSVGGRVQGTLKAAVVWREDRWLVTSVVLETAP